MSIQENKITIWTNPVVNEADRPQRSAADMKAVFDSNSNQLKESLNAVIDALLSTDGAGNIGAAVSGMDGATVAALLAELKWLIDALDTYADTLKSTDGAANIGAEVSGITGDNIAAVLAALKALCDRVETTGDGDLYLRNDGTYGLPTVGSAANGLPAGGTTGQVLIKASSTNFAGYWGGIIDDTISGLLKATNGELAAAEAGVDYQTPLVSGTDYQPPIASGTYATPTEVSNAVSNAVTGHNSASGAHAALFGKKLDAPTQATTLPASGTALTANTIYSVSSTVGTYVFTPPVSGWAHGEFSTASSVAVSFASGSNFLSEAPTIEAGKTYEFDVFDGTWAVQEVVSS